MRRVVPSVLALVLLAPGCIEHARLDPQAMDLCLRDPKTVDVGPIEWGPTTGINVTLLSYGWVSFQLVTCRDMEASLMLDDAFGHGRLQDGQRQPHPYAATLLFPEHTQPSTTLNAAHGIDNVSVVRWDTPGVSNPNPWPRLVQLHAGTTYRLIVATNMDGYQVQLRDQTLHRNFTRGPGEAHGGIVYLVQPHEDALAPDVQGFSTVGAQQSTTRWSLRAQEPRSAFAMIRSWTPSGYDRQGNFSDDIAIRFRPGPEPFEYARHRDGLMGLFPSGGLPIHDQVVGILGPNDTLDVQRTFRTTSAGVADLGSGVATLRIPLEAVAGALPDVASTAPAKFV